MFMLIFVPIGEFIYEKRGTTVSQIDIPKLFDTRIFIRPMMTNGPIYNTASFRHRL
jgi:hypothetical protein